MARKQFTAEQKKAHFDKIRQEWKEAKAAAEGNGKIEAILKHLKSLGITQLSPVNIQLVLMQAEPLGLEGLPYVDFKPYKHWQKSGYQVRQGEKSQIHTITWIGKDKDKDEDEEETYRFPKLTSLFHSNQVDPIID